MGKLCKCTGPCVCCRGLTLGGLVLGIVLAAESAVPAQEWARRLPGVDERATAVSQGSFSPSISSTPWASFGTGPALSAQEVPGGPLAEATVTPARPPIAGDPVQHDYHRRQWCWQLLPEGLIYRSYLAGVREPRFASGWMHERDLGWIWDIALGGRMGILRYGTHDSRLPQGWQLDIEGASMPRLDLEHGRELMAADFRVGVPLTYGRGWLQTKLAYYHLSSHLGDEFMIRNPTASRINFSRDVLLWGNSFYLSDDLRLYAEAGWAFCSDGGSKPWEFQFGVDYSPAEPSGVYGAPFFAINGHLREEVDFGGNMVVQTGWQWRGGGAGHLFRVGMQYFAGMSEQFEFFNRYEEKLGLAVWYDY